MKIKVYVRKILCITHVSSCHLQLKFLLTLGNSIMFWPKGFFLLTTCIQTEKYRPSSMAFIYLYFLVALVKPLSMRHLNSALMDFIFQFSTFIISWPLLVHLLSMDLISSQSMLISMLFGSYVLQETYGPTPLRRKHMWSNTKFSKHKG